MLSIYLVACSMIAVDMTLHPGGRLSSIPADRDSTIVAVDQPQEWSYGTSYAHLNPDILG